MSARDPGLGSYENTAAFDIVLPNVAGIDGFSSYSGVFLTTASVPEPTTLVLLGFGLAGIAFVARKRRGTI